MEVNNMINKVICTLISLALVVLTAVPTSATSYLSKDETICSIELFENGSYAVTTIKNVGHNTKGTVTKNKSYTYYDSSNVQQWMVSLTATFSYNGSTASCTSATPSYSINNTAWKITKAETSISGATATGDFTAKKYVLLVPIQTVNKTLTLTCSASGIVT